MVVKSSRLHFGTIIVRLGPAGGPRPGLRPARFSPWQVVHPSTDTRYLPYSGVRPSEGATIGVVIAGCAAVGKMPTPTMAAASTLSFADGDAAPDAGWERRYATTAWTSESLMCLKFSDG